GAERAQCGAVLGCLLVRVGGGLGGGGSSAAGGSGFAVGRRGLAVGGLRLGDDLVDAAGQLIDAATQIGDAIGHWLGGGFQREQAVRQDLVLRVGAGGLLRHRLRGGAQLLHGR